VVSYAAERYYEVQTTRVAGVGEIPVSLRYYEVLVVYSSVVYLGVMC
jgi:hypothetical protein